jgi:hypothetical protein
MPTFSIFSPLYHSFSSAELYREVAASWRGKAFLYLLLLLALTWIPQMLRTYADIREFIDDQGGAMFDQVPSIVIDGGRLSVDVEQPYFIRFGRDDEIVATIDTTGRIGSLENAEGRILVTDTTVSFRRGPGGGVESFSFSEIDDARFDGNTLRRWAETFAPWVPVAAYPLALVWSFAYRLLQVLVYSLFAMLIAKRLGLRLAFDALYSITIVAITPAVLLKTAFWLSEFTHPLMFIPYVALALGYVYFGVASNRTSAGEA